MPDKRWLALKYSGTNVEAQEVARQQYAELTVMNHEMADRARFQQRCLENGSADLARQQNRPGNPLYELLKEQQEEVDADALAALQQKFGKRLK